MIKKLDFIVIVEKYFLPNFVVLKSKNIYFRKFAKNF